MDEKPVPQVDAANEWRKLRLNARWESRPRRGLVEELLLKFPGLPSDYVALLRLSDGAIIEDIGIWDIASTIKANQRGPEDEAGGLFLFATENEQIYGFDLRPGCKKAVVEVYEHVCWQDAAYVAPSFSELLRLAQLRGEWLDADLKAGDMIDETSGVTVARLGSVSPPTVRDAGDSTGGFAGMLKRLFS